MKTIKTYPLRLPASLKDAVAEISREEGTSMNQFIRRGLDRLDFFLAPTPSGTKVFSYNMNRCSTRSRSDSKRVRR